ncbi:MAG: phosphoesterase [Solirubrobacterales bacterium]|nr:phosphoesterase [Solirubrobacterales bacterium]
MTAGEQTPPWPEERYPSLFGEGLDQLAPEAEAPRGLRLFDWRLSPSGMRLLALVSAVSSGLVIWAGLGRDESSGLAAAIARRRLLAAEVSPAPASSPQAASSSAQTPSSGSESSPEPSSSSEGGEAAPLTPASAPTTASTPATEPAAAAPGAASSPSPTTPEAKKPAAPTVPAETKIKHVFVITLTSPGYEQTWGPTSPAHYLTTQLRPRGTLLSSYYGIAHLDLPNYIAMISGQPPNAQTAADCTNYAEFIAPKPDAAGRLEAPGCVYPVTVLTLGDQLTSTRRQWRAYAEDLAAGPKPVQSCRHPSSNQADETQHSRPRDGYAARHNPFVYFHSLLDLGDCASNDLPLTALAADLATPTKTPNYAFIAPNLCHDGSEAPCTDGSPGGLQAADAFLAEWVPKILASPAYQRDGLLVITFSDAPASDTSGCCGATATPGGTPAAGGGRVGALLLSRFVAPGRESTSSYNHYSLLRTVEDIFGLPRLANAGEAGVESFSGTILRGVFAHK